jgi:quercetin dioxygenase-like cupin family protein
VADGKKTLLAGRERYVDERGVIQDLLGTVDAVTEIWTKAGAVRGNHVHQRTTQWTYIVSGVLEVAWTEDDGVHSELYGQGQLITEAAGVPHAWKALEDTVVLVFTKGPRSGEDYEDDTFRLPENARLLT